MIIIMNEKMHAKEQPAAPEADYGNIMQHVQDMIGNLMKDAVENMHKSEIGEELGEAPSNMSDKMTAQMDITDIKNFIGVMQKFIDNVNIMVAQLETGVIGPDGTDDKFLDGYMATADNVLEIAAFSMKDALTGLSNRHGFENRLVLEWNRARRDKSALGLVIFSVHHSEECECNVGRDDLLIAVSKTLENTIKRSTDFIARWSVGEFAVLLPITDESGASIVAERIRTEIENISIPGIAKKDCNSTVSIGVCDHPPEPNEQPIDFITKAHDAFIIAKEVDGSAIVYA